MNHQQDIILSMSLASVVIFVVAVTYTLVKVKMNVYFKTAIIVLTYGLCFIARAGMDLSRTLASSDISFFIAMRIANALGNRLRWLFFYFFIYEADEVKIKLQSESPQELAG